jgi:hypothetical protein
MTSITLAGPVKGAVVDHLALKMGQSRAHLAHVPLAGTRDFGNPGRGGSIPLFAQLDCPVRKAGAAVIGEKGIVMTMGHRWILDEDGKQSSYPMSTQWSFDSPCAAVVN